MQETVSKSYLEWLKKEYVDSPFWKHMGMGCEKLEPGNVVISMPVKDELMNSNKIMHGGAITSLLDSIIAAAIRSSREVMVATVTLTTQFIAPVTEGTLYASAELLNSSKRIQSVQAKVTNERGEIVATALGTFAVRPLAK